MFKPRYHPKQRGRFERLAWSCAGLLAVASLLGLVGRLHWTLDLFSHFRVQYVQLALILAGVCLWVRFNRQAVGFIALVLFNYAFVYPLYLGRPDVPDKKPIRAMQMNINAGNGNTKQVLGAIETFAPDLLMLEEVTPKWAEELETLSTNYPYRVAQPQPDCFGIMLLSKFPLKNGVVVEIGDAGVPSIMARVLFPDKEITLIVTHPLPPIGHEYAAFRNGQLAELPQIVRNQKRPVLLMGDLNTSPWSPYFRKMLKDSGLKDSMKGFGFQPSWPSHMPLLRIPIDHALYSDGITICGRMVGRGVGSDHLPLIVDFTVD